MLSGCGEGVADVYTDLEGPGSEDLLGAYVDESNLDDEVATTSEALTAFAGISYRSDLEAQVAAKIQEYRISKGLRPFVGEARLIEIARERAGFMINKKKNAGCATWFTHKYISGCTETTQSHFGMLLDQKIGTSWPWYLWGENIAWNNYPDDATADVIVTGWKNSPGHNALLLSNTLSYVGFGVAKDDTGGIKVGVAVFLEAKDITRPRATSLSAAVNTTGATTVRWGGGTDTFLYQGVAYPLQTHNAGFKNYDLRYRKTGTTTWTTSVTGTTATSRNLTLTRGVTYDIQLRIRDNNSNVGSRLITFTR
jgi:uncharacterized protein YkwD